MSIRRRVPGATTTPPRANSFFQYSKKSLVCQSKYRGSSELSVGDRVLVGGCG